MEFTDDQLAAIDVFLVGLAILADLDAVLPSNYTLEDVRQLLLDAISSEETVRSEPTSEDDLVADLAVHFEDDAAALDGAAVVLARRYVVGELDWETADALINDCWTPKLHAKSWPAIADAVYLAFDAGEVAQSLHRQDPNATTAPLVLELLDSV